MCIFAELAFAFDWCWGDSDAVTHCYYVTESVEGADDARATCLSGTSLATVTSEEEMQAMGDYLSASKLLAIHIFSYSVTQHSNYIKQHKIRNLLSKCRL